MSEVDTCARATAGCYGFNAELMHAEPYQPIGKSDLRARKTACIKGIYIFIFLETTNNLPMDASICKLKRCILLAW